MNYDAAHALAKSMRASDEYKALMNAQKEVEGNEESLKMVRDFITLQMQYEYSKMAGQEDQDTLNRLLELTNLVNANSAARAFLQAYTIWSQISQDIYRIVSEPITEGMSILEK